MKECQILLSDLPPTGDVKKQLSMGLGAPVIQLSNGRRRQEQVN